MRKSRFNPRVVLAALALLTSIGFIYFAQSDHVPHDRMARVQPEVFWAAVARPNLAQRPTDIVVYAPHLDVQLVTCVGRPPAGPSTAKYFYQRITPGGSTVEARLLQMGIPFRTPWWDSKWMADGPWVTLALAVVLLILPAITGLFHLLTEAKSTAPAPAVQPSPQISDADLARVRELDAAMENALSASAPDQPTPPPPAPLAPSAPMRLTGEPLQALPQPVEEQKDYTGEYYPVALPRKPQGFSLVELLIVIGVLGVLISLLLPALAGARKDANQIACAANLRSISQGLGIYENENDGYIPASYSYVGQTIVAQQQQYSFMGYVHWSDFLYNTAAIPTGAFLCPELEQGGLPPTNTTPDNLLPGQVVETPGAIDQQAPHVAYTLNEALSPRNKFVLGFQSALRVYQFVHASSIPNSAGTILATEWAQTGARESAGNSGANFYVYSHRPVHGFVGLDGTLDMYLLKPGVGYRRITPADLDPDPATASSSTTRLDWVGRNHGHAGGYPNQARTNFLYLDGHVECKSIYETLAPFQWGGSFYTLVPNGDLQQ
jgi:prepilin-type N-terminal cleavage/methylation domain-containing protein/prepilin-type processing-associated H-X9-DG protein